METFDQPVAADYPLFLGSKIEQPDPQQARFHIVPVPQQTIDYLSAEPQGCASILQASWQLERWDGDTSPCEQGIYTHLPINSHGESQAVSERIAALVYEVVSLGKMPVAIGGDCSVSWGVIKGLLDAGETDFGVVQIDAHTGLRNAAEGSDCGHRSRMNPVVEQGVALFQLGGRGYSDQERDTRAKQGVHGADADQLVPSQINAIDLPEGFPSKVFFSLDIDGLDPSVFPSTGTPIPGGLGWYQTLNLFESVAKQRRIIGFDLVGHVPIAGSPGYDFAAALLVYKLMGIVQRTQPESAPDV